jgi:hypothetical protein
MKKYVDGVLVDLTSEEITEFNKIKDNVPSQFEMAMSDLRLKRNKLLAETDYLALSDNTMSEEMTTYRQELRDITEGLTTEEEVQAVEFPTKP